MRLPTVFLVLLLSSSALADDLPGGRVNPYGTGKPPHFATWGAKVWTAGGGVGGMAYGVGREIPLPGSPWICQASAPTQQKNVESVQLLCSDALNAGAAISTRCELLGQPEENQMILFAKAPMPTYVVTVVCDPIIPPAAPSAKPADKSL